MTYDNERQIPSYDDFSGLKNQENMLNVTFKRLIPLLPV